MGAMMEADIRPPSLKLAALAMAHFLNEQTGQLNPSMARIAKACGLSEVQARRQVHELIRMGLLSVVANHDGGASGSSRSYLLHVEHLACPPLTGESPTPITSDTPLAGDTPLTDERDPSHGRSSPLSPVIATPLTGESQTEKEQRRNREKNRETAPRKRSTSKSTKPMVVQPDDLVAVGFPPEVADEFIAHKSAVKAPLTERAWRDHLAEAQKAGWTPLQAAEKVMARGWKGFEAKYVANDRQATASSMTFAERDDLMRKKRHAEMVGKPLDMDQLSPAQRAEVMRELAPRARGLTRHSGFEQLDYREGVAEDGSFV